MADPQIRSRGVIPHTIETVTGRLFDYHAPVIDIDDVAHGLAHACRFAGHTSRFYSVAEHSVLVANIVHAEAPHIALAALWHDAHEAYMGDLPTPLKAIIGKRWKHIASRIDEAVSDHLGLEVDLRHPIIKLADELAMAYEASLLMTGPAWEFTRHMQHEQADAACTSPLALSPYEAAALFKLTHLHLTSGEELV
jgi:hypothetical protein